MRSRPTERGLMMAMLPAALLLFAAPSHASRNCMNMSQARKIFPDAHLYWHGRAHCWDNQPARRIADPPHRTFAEPVLSDPNGNEISDDLPPLAQQEPVEPPPIARTWYGAITSAAHAQEMPTLMRVIDIPTTIYDEGEYNFLDAQAPEPSRIWPRTMAVLQFVVAIAAVLGSWRALESISDRVLRNWG